MENNRDIRSMVSKSDFFLKGCTKEKYMGMAIGNGVTGSMVWIEPSAIKLQVNRVDVFATNSATTAANPDMASPEYLGRWEYCGGCAFFDIMFNEECFTPQSTDQRLGIYDGELKIKGDSISAEVKVWSEQDVFCIDITDKRTHKSPITLSLSMLREKQLKRNCHSADSSAEAYDETIGLFQEFSEKCSTGITENDHYCASAVLSCVRGCEVLQTRVSDDKTASIMTVAPMSESYSIYVSSGASFENIEAAVTSSKSCLETATGTSKEKIDSTHREWWHDYWSKAYIDTPCNPEFSFYWYTYLYYIGCTMKGEYPAKYNGLLFSCDGDIRSWGGQFWWYNQSRSHYGLDTANHGDMNKPLFNMLLNAIPRYQKACEQVWGGNGGIILPETDAFSGPEILPKEIAADLKNLLLYDIKPTESLLRFMENRSGMNSRWCVFMGKAEQEKGDALSFRWHSNLSYNAGDAANSMWNHYLYSLDEDFLRRIYPWIKGVAEFYRFHPCRVQDENGYVHLHHLGWAESITHATDVIDDLVMMRGIYPIAIKASKLLDTDADLRDKWEEAYKQIPLYPTSEMEDAISVRPHKSGLPTYAVARKPCQMEWPGNTNDCRLRMLHNFDLVTLETKKDKPEEFEMANRSFEATEVGEKLLNGELPGFNGFVWNRGLVEAARLGRTDAVRSGLPVLVKQFSGAGNTEKPHYPNRMPWTNGKESYSIQELGVYSDQLQEPLLQSVSNGAACDDTVIYVFPAWPPEWEASFKLLAKGGFLVESEMKDGKVSFVKILSQKGGICRLHNSWEGKSISVACNGCEVDKTVDDSIVFDTQQGKSYEIYIK